MDLLGNSRSVFSPRLGRSGEIGAPAPPLCVSHLTISNWSVESFRYPAVLATLLPNPDAFDLVQLDRTGWKDKPLSLPLVFGLILNIKALRGTFMVGFVRRIGFATLISLTLYSIIHTTCGSCFAAFVMEEDLGYFAPNLEHSDQE